MLGEPPNGPGNGSVYVHFPYCKSKCPYCDYNSHVVEHDDRLYGQAILQELSLRAHELEQRPLASIYLGGGTPSLWHPEPVSEVVEAILNRFPEIATELQFAGRSDPEVTIEVNPGDCPPQKLEAFFRAGVNRFSIGCQSFLDEELSSLGRKHSGEEAKVMVQAAKATGARVSLDLMYGLPKQTEKQVAHSIEQALAFEPDHISAYTLTVEPETVLARRTRLGLFRPMPDDEQARLMRFVYGQLAAAGFTRYEVSSFARGHRFSVHNSGYWLGAAYLGLGAGAHSYLPRGQPVLHSAHRQENYKSPARYLETALGEYQPMQSELQTPAEVLADRLMVAFRSRFGLSVSELAQSFSLHAQALQDALDALRHEGLLDLTGTRYRPTDQGFLFNDRLAARMLDLGQEVFRFQGTEPILTEVESSFSVSS